jgi:hypothetical protein
MLNDLCALQDSWLMALFIYLVLYIHFYLSFSLPYAHFFFKKNSSQFVEKKMHLSDLC